MTAGNQPHTHQFLEPTWFWDGKSDHPDAHVGVYIRDRVYAGKKLPTTGISFSATHLPLPNRLVTPGWVNFHTHLELSLVRQPPYEGRFVDWLGQVMAQGPKSGDAAARAAVAGARESLSCGVTTLYDITRNPIQVRQALAHTPLRVRSFGEITGLAKRFHRGDAMLFAALESSCLENSRITTGLSPHAPYSTDADWYVTCAGIATQRGLPLMTHLCETPEERKFLTHHTGPFRDLWNTLGDWESGIQTYEAGPVHWLESHDVFRNLEWIIAHGNNLTDEELALLKNHNITLVHCPRTHAYFRRPPFPLERYRNAGLRVKLGTDSAASAGDLDLLADARLLARQNPALPTAEILKMMIDTPIEEGAPADFVVWRTETQDPLRELLENDTFAPLEVWIDGHRVWDANAIPLAKRIPSPT